MEYLTNLEIRKHFSCDILVIGGGVAGFSAAVCAARTGADVILAERDGCLGGTATVGLVGPFMSAFDPTGSRQVIAGFMDEFIRRMEAAGGAIHPTNCLGGDSYSAYRINGHIGVTPFDPECFKLTAEAMCKEAGVRLLYHVLFVSCEKDGDSRIRTAYFATKNGIYAIDAKQFIDCTGDADLAAACGAPTVFGDEEGRTQVSSIFFLIDGVDKGQLEAHLAQYPESTHQTQRYFEDAVKQAQLEGRFPCQRSRVSVFEGMNGIWRVNMAQYDGKVDFSDPEEVTKAETVCRKQIHPLIDFLKENVPGFANIRLLQSSQSLGIRESRRIVGEYTLTMEDMAAGRRFEDGICLVGSAVDFHGKNDQKGNYRGAYYVPGREAAQIPLRCLLPQSVDNLLAAGRCLSADQMAHSAVRVMPPCFAMGQAAGTAAALAVQKGISPKQLDCAVLREKLLADGVCLE